MATQAEEVLEINLVAQLGTLGYDIVTIKDEADLLDNLRRQLEKHNRTTLSATEFKQVLNTLNKGGIFDRAKTLREKLEYEKDNGDAGYLELINQEHWCQNQFQVSRQITVAGKYKNRYDVTLLINGLPLVQIELKKRGMELKEAFNQISRYQRHSYWSETVFGLFRYVQLFVISNGVNTKYFANNPKAPFKQTNYWAASNNKRITRLEAFASAFLEKCHLSKMICKYLVINEVDHVLMVLRPYQFYAVEAIIERVRNTQKNGYIWHTTGSGKTLTSFKASQILIRLPQVHKVVFVVDRRDLDGQTINEFNHFQKGSVDSSVNTNVLVQQFTDTYTQIEDGKKKLRQLDLIVTTIQKLNNAIKNKRYLKRMEALRDKNIVFIFDECHRSQFGETHERIKQFFVNHQMFGFTGTPIFADNASRNELGKRTTKDLFEECLHKYVITDAIRDQNVLRFAVEYHKTFKKKENFEEKQDRKVAAIDTKEVFESDQHVEEVINFILQEHDRKTHGRHFSAIFCVSGINMLIKYYDRFKAKKEAGEHDLRIATIFSYGTNEEDAYADGSIPDPDFDFANNNNTKNLHSREKMEEYVEDYNRMFQTNFNTRDSKLFYEYYRDIGTKLKNREKTNPNPAHRIDILLVVNMFLTGFDAKRVNTMYVDKNLRQHGLIQAFSRTNRVISTKKSHGFIVCFRKLKKQTDEAVTLFSNKDAIEEILMQPYEIYEAQFITALTELRKIAPEVDSVDDFYSEDEELEFVQAFRKLIRLNNLMSGFTEYDLEDLGMDEQEFADYKSKYADLYLKVKDDRKKEKESILQDIDFEIELIQRDEINVAYILQLLGELMRSNTKKREQKRKEIMDLLGGEITLRSKKELIEKFINQHLPKVKDIHDIPDAFADFWNTERQIAFVKLHEEEDLEPVGLLKVLQDFIYTGRNPLIDTIRKIQNQQLPLFLFSDSVERITDKIKRFVETFEEGIGSEQEAEGTAEAKRYELKLPPTSIAAEGEDII